MSRKAVWRLIYTNSVIFFLQKAQTYLGDVKVDAEDVTSNVYKIRDGNSDNGIFVRNKNYSKVDKDNKSCCNFEYFVLNDKCKNLVSYLFKQTLDKMELIRTSQFSRHV